MSTPEQRFTEITSLEELRELVPDPLGPARDKERGALSGVDRAWLEASPFCLVATSDADGNCDVSPKGDPPGFVKALDEHTVAVPERPGNRRVDGFRNVLSNPHVGLLSIIPGRGDTLRINGRARLVRDAPFFDDMVVKGHRPVLALVVDVDTVFHHCAKAFLRSRLWSPQSWEGAGAGVPSRPRIAKMLERPDEPLEELERYYGQEYSERLYR